MYLCGGIASIIGAILGGRLIDKIGPIPICFLGSGFVIVALITQINFDIIPIFLFFMLMMGGASLRMTSVMTQISEIPEPEQRGAFMSLQNTVRNFMMAMGSGLSGLFLSQSSNGHLQGMGHIAILAAIGSLFIPFIMFYIAAFLRKRGTAY
jgi:predicted MFS family arabinose efflux permease